MSSLELSTLVRSFQILVLVFFLLRMIHFLVAYVRVIWPLRRQIGDRNVLAPPAIYTLRYHIDVTLLAVVSMCALIYAIANDFPLNPLTFITILVWADLTWTIERFYDSYREVLRGSREVGLDSYEPDHREDQ
jgi:hypothetical protein